MIAAGPIPGLQPTNHHPNRHYPPAGPEAGCIPIPNSAGHQQHNPAPGGFRPSAGEGVVSAVLWLVRNRPQFSCSPQNAEGPLILFPAGHSFLLFYILIMAPLAMPAVGWKPAVSGMDWVGEQLAFPVEQWSFGPPLILAFRLTGEGAKQVLPAGWHMFFLYWISCQIYRLKENSLSNQFPSIFLQSTHQ